MMVVVIISMQVNHTNLKCGPIRSAWAPRRAASVRAVLRISTHVGRLAGTVKGAGEPRLRC